MGPLKFVQSTTPTEGAADATAVDSGTTRPGAEGSSAGGVPDIYGALKAAMMLT